MLGNGACGPRSGLFDLITGEIDVLGAIEKLAVEFLAQLHAGRRSKVLVVLLDTLDLDPLDILPARVRSALDRRPDAMHLVAHVIRQTAHQRIIAVAHPGFVRGRIDARLESAYQKTNGHLDVSYAVSASAGVFDLMSPTTLTLTRMAFPRTEAIGVGS